MEMEVPGYGREGETEDDFNGCSEEGSYRTGTRQQEEDFLIGLSGEGN